MLPLLFLCCDMGDTTALIPVMHELCVREIDFRVMTMGAAISKLTSDSKLQGKMIELREAVDTVKARSKPLENVAALIEGLQPLLIISGPASKAQEQLLEAIPAKRKIVYLDNFNYALSSPTFETVKGVASVAKKIICVSPVVKEQILSAQVGRLKAKDIKPLGRPSLESWVKQVQAIDKTAVLKKIGFDAGKVVTFIGGYGTYYDNGVNQAYKRAQARLIEAGFQVHEQHHPNVVKEQTLTTPEAVAIANIIICYDSTVGFEALFAGKKVIYLQPEGVPIYNNSAIQTHLATSVRTDDELLEAIHASAAGVDPYETLQITRNSTEAITNYILKQLQKCSS